MVLLDWRIHGFWGWFMGSTWARP